MKTTRQYLSGCTWCNATGIVSNPSIGISTNITIICPVCQGTKTVVVTETFEDEPESEDQPKKIFQTSNDYYGIKPK